MVHRREVIKSLGLLAALACWRGNVPAADLAENELLRLRGRITRITDTSMQIRARNGARLRVALPPNLGVSEVFPVDIGAFTIGAVVGATGMLAADGTLHAMEVRVFPGGGGPADGQRGSNLAPNSVLTNGHLKSVMAGADGWQLIVSGTGGDVTIVVPRSAPMASYRPGDRTLLVPGAWVYLHARTVDGQLQAVAATAGRNGFSPAQ